MVLTALRELWNDRRGGPLEKAVIWAFLLGGFYYVWTSTLRPAFQESAGKQADILTSAGEQ